MLSLFGQFFLTGGGCWSGVQVFSCPVPASRAPLSQSIILIVFCAVLCRQQSCKGSIKFREILQKIGEIGMLVCKL